MSFEGYFITAAWDQESEVWITAACNLPGLTVEAATFEAFASEANELAPQLVELNDGMPAGLPLRIIRSESHQIYEAAR